MIRWIYVGIVSLVLAGFVHLATVFIVPYVALRGAYHRMIETVPVNTMTQLDKPEALQSLLPSQDPAFELALCRYDLAAGPLSVKVPVTPAYTALAFYDYRGGGFYAINDRAAGRKVIELELMTLAQKAQLPDDEEITAADRLIVASPTSTGLLLVRALVAEPGQRPQVRQALKLSSCVRQQP